MIKIKVCGMRNPVNIREVSLLRPDYMGFNFYAGSKRFVGENPDIAMFEEMPARIRKVGVFVNEDPGKILELAYHYDLDVIQLHGSETVKECRTIKSAGYQVIKVFGIDRGFNFTTLSPFTQYCDFFMFDTKSELYGGTGLKFNWDKIHEYKYNIPFFLGGGIGPEDHTAILAIDHPSFIAADLNSRFEIEPGLKNVNQLKAFFKEIRSSTA